MTDITEDAIDEMDKDALAEYAQATHNKTLNKRLGIDKLRVEVKAMLNGEAEAPVAEEKPGVLATHVKNPENGRILEMSPAFRKREDLIPCDKDGNEQARV